jgi:uncharacterized protein
MAERAVQFECEGASLVGVLHEGARRNVGIVVVVGGPQYRVGSHRQFVLLARALAAAGYPVLRFDVRGMGDSAGDSRNFEHIAPDIGAAIDLLQRESPGLQRVVLWGLCDGASASLMYAPGDARVAGLALLNPWARSDAGQAEAYIKHYYLRRLTSGEFWRSVLTGKAQVLKAALELVRNLALARQAGAKSAPATSFTVRMQRAAEAFKGFTLVVTSGNDLTAREFEAYCARSPAWHSMFERPTTERRRLEPADHTFSTGAWRGTVEQWTRDWLQARFPA